MSNMNETTNISFDSKDDTIVVAGYGYNPYNDEDQYFANLAPIISESKYKYAEDQILADLKAYIDKTYGQHYKTDDKIECFDAWMALGDATTTFRDTAIKYLWRYGKKNGNNKDDLMKTLHYVMLALYNDHYKKD